MKKLDIPLPFHPAGTPFIAAAAAVTLVLFFVSPFVFYAGLILTAYCAYFFRNPDRMTPTRPGLLVSPADGKVVAIQSAIPDEEFGLGNEPRTRISIFLSIFNVHVNRIPADGRIVSCSYRTGKFFNASLDKASDDNERMAVTMTLSGTHPHMGEKITFVQIAGLIARRILCTLKNDQEVKAGERYGLIRFGSRVDIYLPPNTIPMVIVGQTTVAGETILADMTSSEGPREGEVRE